MAPMHPDDLGGVVDAEDGVPSAWTRLQFEEELQQPTGFQYVVRILSSSTVIAFLCGRLLANEAEILKLTVAEPFRRQRIGKELLKETLAGLQRKRVEACFLELRVSNIAARKLYEKSGFQQAVSREAYYEGPVEDAVVMVKRF